VIGSTDYHRLEHVKIGIDRYLRLSLVIDCGFFVTTEPRIPIALHCRFRNSAFHGNQGSSKGSRRCLLGSDVALFQRQTTHGTLKERTIVTALPMRNKVIVVAGSSSSAAVLLVLCTIIDNLFACR